MDSSETHIKAINLGKQLVKELSLEQSGDTITRWMAYYLAEQLTLVETVSGPSKVAAEERCFNTVLAIWERRATFPSGTRPFEEFEPIMTTLARLNPDAPQPFFYRRNYEGDSPKNENTYVIDLMSFVESVDVTARVLIEMAVTSAAENASSESTRTLLREALPSKHGGEIKVLHHILKEDDTSELDARVVKAQMIEKRLQQLDNFLEVCKGVKCVYKEELKSLSK